MESLAIFTEFGDKRGVARFLEGMAALATAQMQPRRALLLAGAAAALRKSLRAPLSPPEQSKLKRLLQPARQALSETAVAAASVEGQTVRIEQAIEYALTPEATG